MHLFHFYLVMWQLSCTYIRCFNLIICYGSQNMQFSFSPWKTSWPLLFIALLISLILLHLAKFLHFYLNLFLNSDREHLEISAREEEIYLLSKVKVYVRWAVFFFPLIWKPIMCMRRWMKSTCFFSCSLNQVGGRSSVWCFKYHSV